MNNIKIEYKNGIENNFVLISTEDLKLPFLSFKNKEDAELAVSAAKVLKAYNKDMSNLMYMLPYVFRVMGINNEWT